MTTETGFTPHHICTTREDLSGNQGRGRFVFLPGSDGRAQQISSFFKDRRVVESPRAHHVYLGTLDTPEGPMDVAAVASGMGCPSLDIIANELFHLGVSRILRVGTAGAVDAGKIRVGQLLVATAAVRDEATSGLYVPPEFPAVAHRQWVESLLAASRALGHSDITHSGIVHSKDSLFAREFHQGPMGRENRRYMEILRGGGVMASEMESSHLFVLSSIFPSSHPEIADREIRAGSLLAIIGDDTAFADRETVTKTTNLAIEVALEAARKHFVADMTES